MRALYLIMGAVVLSTGVIATAPEMFWISPLNATSDYFVPEYFPMERGVWADLALGIGSRGEMPIAHLDSKGSLWLMGGNSDVYSLNAMWNYDLNLDQYRWVAGKNTTDSQYFNLGKMGVPADDVFPGQRYYAAHTIDKNDNIWIYGNGDGRDNSLWMFNTTSLQFTYVGGNASNTNAIFGDLGVASAQYWPGRLQGACMVVDSKNNLWMFGGYYNRAFSGVWHYNTASHMWSLQHGDPTSTVQDPDYANLFWPGRWAPGCTIDTDDRVWLFGGYAETSPTNWNDMWSFDTKNVTWRVERETNSTLFQGNVVSFDTFDIGNFPCQRDLASMVDRRDGTIMMYGGRIASKNTALNDVWIFDKTSKLWKVVFGNPNNDTNVNHVYGQYRGAGSQLGSRHSYAIEHGLNAKGNLLIFGGESYATLSGNIFNDLWIIPQDQCATDLHDCDPNASCTMKSWSYECTCNEGYTGDGKTCTVGVAPTSNQPSSLSPTATPTATPKATTTSGTSSHCPTVFFSILIVTILLLA